MAVLTPANVRQFHERGYLLMPAFVDEALIREARAVVSVDHPEPDDYFANPADYPLYGKTQFSLGKFPFGDFALNRLVVADVMVQAAAQLLGTDDVRLTKGEFWAKYQGAIDYEQAFHRDFYNHTLVVPRRDHRYKEVTTFIYMNDVDEGCGPTALLPRALTDDIPFGAKVLPDTVPFDPHSEELLATGPAGTVLFYSYDVFHRGTNLTGDEAYRFAVLADYRRADAPWIARQGWPDSGNGLQMHHFLTRISPPARCLFDIPPPGHEYWNEQTIADMAIRYPDMDMAPYARALGVSER